MGGGVSLKRCRPGPLVLHRVPQRLVRRLRRAAPPGRSRSAASSVYDQELGRLPWLAFFFLRARFLLPPFAMASLLVSAPVAHRGVSDVRQSRAIIEARALTRRSAAASGLTGSRGWRLRVPTHPPCAQVSPCSLRVGVLRAWAPGLHRSTPSTASDRQRGRSRDLLALPRQDAAALTVRPADRSAGFKSGRERH